MSTLRCVRSQSVHYNSFQCDTRNLQNVKRHCFSLMFFTDWRAWKPSLSRVCSGSQGIMTTYKN
jgi:hypothetical protein